MTEDDSWKYLMAAEKMETLLFLMDQTMNYFDECKIDCENSVKSVLEPHLDRITGWMKKSG